MRGHTGSFSPQSTCLEELVLECHVILWLKPDAGAEDVRQCSALLVERIDDRRTRWCERSLQHVAQNAENSMEPRPLSIRTVFTVSTPLNAGHHLSDDHKVDDQRRG